MTGNFERFQYFNFEINFLKSASPFQKTGSTKIDNTAFLYKTALSEANVKTNGMERTKLTRQKERTFASDCFLFSNILFRFKNLA